MSLELDVVRPLENQRVLISEKNTDKKGHVQERYYVLPAKNSDKFMKSLKNAKFNDSFQKSLSMGLVALLGISTALQIKASKGIRVVSGLAVSALTYFATKHIDSSMNKILRKLDLKQYKAEEVTGQDLNEIQ